MVDYNVFKEDINILDMVQVIDQLFLDQNLDLVIQKTKDLVLYIQETSPLSNRLLYEVYVYLAVMMLQSQQINLFYNYMFFSQQYGTHNDNIESFLFEAFVKPNLLEMQQNYEHNTKLLAQQMTLNSDNFPEFNHLQYWTLPTIEKNYYFLYDKQKHVIIKRLLIMDSNEIEELITTDVFSNYLCDIDYEPFQLISISNAAKLRNKKAYVVIRDIQKFLASLQGSKLSMKNIDHLVIFEHANAFKQYFENSSQYLPRNVSERQSGDYSLTNIIKSLHYNRLNNAPKEEKSVLLSIGIPSYNRGHRALLNIKHLLQLCYDYEVEFIVSNNGTVNETKEQYDEISAIKDSRITYFSFDTNQGFSKNFTKVCELAKGQYILFISDEDYIDINVLPSILDMLSNYEETLAIMKTSTTVQIKWEDVTASMGESALSTFMFTSNYMSGHIFNRELIQQYKAIDYLKLNQNNNIVYWYPHMYLELLLAQYGDIISTSNLLVLEGKAEKTEFEKSVIASNVSIPHYATIESRLEQHRDFLIILSQLEINLRNLDWYRKMHLYLCNKTFALCKLSLNKYYLMTGQDITTLKKKVLNVCLNNVQYQQYISTVDDYYEADSMVMLKLFNDQFNN